MIDGWSFGVVAKIKLAQVRAAPSHKRCTEGVPELPVCVGVRGEQIEVVESP